jgi:hypothetical protein
MAKGDLVLIMAGHDLFLGAGIVDEKPYSHQPILKQRQDFFDHTRKVRWLTDHEYGKIKLKQPLKGFNRTLLRITPDHKYWKILENA